MLVTQPFSTAKITKLISTSTCYVITAYCFLHNSFTIWTLSKMQIILEEINFIILTRTSMSGKHAFCTVYFITFVTFGLNSFFNINEPLFAFLVRTEPGIGILWNHWECMNFLVFLFKFISETFIKLSFYIHNFRTVFRGATYFLKSWYFIINIMSQTWIAKSMWTLSNFFLISFLILTCADIANKWISF